MTDPAFSFFCELDIAMMSYETHENMNIHGPDIYSHVIDKLTQNQSLMQSWLSLFTLQVPSAKPLEDTDMWGDQDVDLEHMATVHCLYEDVIQRYEKMSCAQFRKK